MLQLKRLRKERGMTAREMAAKLGMKADTYRKWEYGVNGMSIENACAVADVLDVTLDELVGRPVSVSALAERKTYLTNLYERCEDGRRDTLIKTAGRHNVTIELYRDITATVVVLVGEDDAAPIKERRPVITPPTTQRTKPCL